MASYSFYDSPSSPENENEEEDRRLRERLAAQSQSLGQPLPFADGEERASPVNVWEPMASAPQDGGEDREPPLPSTIAGGMVPLADGGAIPDDGATTPWGGQVPLGGGEAPPATDGSEVFGHGGNIPLPPSGGDTVPVGDGLPTFDPYGNLPPVGGGQTLPPVNLPFAGEPTPPDKGGPNPDYLPPVGGGPITGVGPVEPAPDFTPPYVPDFGLPPNWENPYTGDGTVSRGTTIPFAGGDDTTLPGVDPIEAAPKGGGDTIPMAPWIPATGDGTNPPVGDEIPPDTTIPYAGVDPTDAQPKGGGDEVRPPYVPDFDLPPQWEPPTGGGPAVGGGTTVPSDSPVGGEEVLPFAGGETLPPDKGGPNPEYASPAGPTPTVGSGTPIGEDDLPVPFAGDAASPDGSTTTVGTDAGPKDPETIVPFADSTPSTTGTTTTPSTTDDGDLPLHTPNETLPSVRTIDDTKPTDVGGSKPTTGTTGTTGTTKGDTGVNPVTVGRDSAGFTPTAKDLIGTTITSGTAPDRVQMAKDIWNTMAAESAPAYEAALRGAKSQAAGVGQLGSGMLRTSLGDLALQRSRDLDANRQKLMQEALTGTIEDRYKDLGLKERQQEFQAKEQAEKEKRAIEYQKIANALGLGGYSNVTERERAVAEQELANNEMWLELAKVLGVENLKAKFDPNKPSTPSTPQGKTVVSSHPLGNNRFLVFYSDGTTDEVTGGATAGSGGGTTNPVDTGGGDRV